MEAERFGGRMSAAEVLQAASDDLRFSWLRRLSELITAFDEARRSGDPDGEVALVETTRSLLAPPDPSSSFGARYLQALQDHPAVVLAHRDVMAEIPAEEPRK
jgi:hypothetical protein